MDFLVTTRLEKVPTDRQVIMVDGHVPGWNTGRGDYLFDHHRDGGREIQIDEIPFPLALADNYVYVTTQVDADACVAAAWIELTSGSFAASFLLTPTEEVSRCRHKLQAIAYDCDHLCVPDVLENLAIFAANAVATLKISSDSLIEKLALPRNRKEWSIDQKEAYASEAFKRGALWLIEAALGQCRWPGQQGEADEYWQQVEANVQKLKHEGRVTYYRNCALVDMKGLGGAYIDPRCAIAIIEEDFKIHPYLLPVTLTRREIFVEGQFAGYSYTLGCFPKHPRIADLDYLKSGVFAALTDLERLSNSRADGWGGRETVGGSGWNTPSILRPDEVIDVVLSCLEGVKNEA